MQQVRFGLQNCRPPKRKYILCSLRLNSHFCRIETHEKTQTCQETPRAHQESSEAEQKRQKGHPRQYARISN